MNCKTGHGARPFQALAAAGIDAATVCSNHHHGPRPRGVEPRKAITVKRKAPAPTDSELRAMIVAGCRTEAERLRKLLSEPGRDIPVADLANPDDGFVLRIARKDGSVWVGSSRHHDPSFLLFTGGGLLADVMPDRSLAAIAHLLKHSPELLADTATLNDRDRRAAIGRLQKALAELPSFDDAAMQPTARFANVQEDTRAASAGGA